MSVLQPDQFLTSVLAIDLDELMAKGYDAILIDLDNTVLPRLTDVVPPEIVAWVEQTKARGFTFCMTSNNWHERCHRAAAQLDIPLICKAMKPCPIAFWLACRRHGLKRKTTMVVGDQLFTDVLGARLGGFKVIMVKPLAEYDLPHTLFLRKFERFFLGGLEPLR